MVEQIFFSQQAKQSLFISNKYIYELLHELPNHLRLQIFGNWEISGKFQNFPDLLPTS